MNNSLSPNAGTPQLVYETGMAICERMFAICDRQQELLADCQTRGFCAFASWNEFDESFCDSAEDSRIHRRVLIEQAKIQLSRMAARLPTVPGKIKQPYSSPFIEELKRQRDELNGCAENEIDRRFPANETWMRSQYDPCVRRQMMVKQRNALEYERKRRAAEDDQWVQFACEVRNHSSGMGMGREVSGSDRCAFVIDAAKKYGTELGFSHRKSKSSIRKPAVWKALTDYWDLRWIVPTTDDFMFAPFLRRDDRVAQPSLSSELVLCASRLKGDPEISAKPGDYLDVAYQFIVPQFIRSYQKFYDYDELELVVKAQFALLELVLPDIEDAVMRVLDRV